MSAKIEQEQAVTVLLESGSERQEFRAIGLVAVAKKHHRVRRAPTE